MNAARHTRVGLAIVFVAACQSATPTALPQPTSSSPTFAPPSATPPLQPTVTPTNAPPTATPTATPSATVAVTPSPTPSAEPTANAAEGLVVDWRLVSGDPGLGQQYGITFTGHHSGVVFANTFFMAGITLDDEGIESPHIFSSSNGRAWEQATVPDLRTVSDLVVGPGGLLAVGDPVEDNTPLWLTTNGTDWERVVDPDLAGGRISRVGATNDGFVALGSSVWTSLDGREWQESATESGIALAQTGVQRMIQHGDELLALAGGPTTSAGSLEVWRSHDLTNWMQVAELPHSRHAHNVVVAHGPLGYIATGYDNDAAEIRSFMWLSADGISWSEVSPTVGPVTDIFADDLGLIAVGFLGTSTGCATQEGEIQGFTWTSLDGRMWATMPLADFVGARVDQLFRNGRTLIGAGVRFEKDDLETGLGAVWTAKLPELPPSGPAPTAAPSPTPEPGGCG